MKFLEGFEALPELTHLIMWRFHTICNPKNVIYKTYPKFK